jgi:hypothetical protein
VGDRFRIRNAFSWSFHIVLVMQSNIPVACRLQGMSYAVSSNFDAKNRNTCLGFLSYVVLNVQS